MIKPISPRCEYLQNPLGIDVLQPRLSWVVAAEERNQIQSTYQILVADSVETLAADEGNLWDSGRVDNNQSTHVVYQGAPLSSGQRCWWKVRLWDREGRPSVYSPPAWWQMGLLKAAEWQGQWISFDTGPATEMEMKACPYLRRVFRVAQPIHRATLYVTAKGLYRLRLNGQPVGNAVFAPDWADYRQRVFYDTYDVTSLLQQGDNAMGAILGDGWYSGYLGWGNRRKRYGDTPQLFAQLNLEYPDGSVDILTTDSGWKGSAGPILFSSFYMGETYDAGREMPGWDQAEFDDSGWQAVRVEKAERQIQLTAQSAEPMRLVQEIKPKSVAQPQPGVYVFDLGQNMVGWARLRVRGEAGTRVQLRFAEILSPNGMVYTENLRSARSTDTYILKGGGPEIWEPHFTFHGFRYVEVTGSPDEADLETITGCVLQSDLPQTGFFECSKPMANQLWRNILWGQKGNFLSVPTDCPQRDERLGWMGDALVFARTACFNMNAAAFYTRWMISVADGQSPEGAFPDVAPQIVSERDGAPAWGDAGIVVPWMVYQAYGDTRLIERHYQAMARWLDYIHAANPHLLRTKRLNNNYGDWVAVDTGVGAASKEMLATAFWVYIVRLMARMARAIGRDDDARKYMELFEGIKAAFNTAYVFPDGRIEDGSQSAYAVALQFDLLPADLRPAAAQHLVENIKARDWHLSTGFLGTPYLCPALAETGHQDVAYRLLNNDTYPSWGHMIKHGATTMWERWNSILPEGEAHPPRMNSFNHYAFGAVGEWLYRFVAGIDTDPRQPGYQHILIYPRPGGGLTYAKAEYDSIRGRIVSDWKIEGHEFHLKVTIPANTTATVYLPTSNPDTVTESGQPVEQVEGVRFVKQETELAVFRVGSGDYHFVAAFA
ncbi:MAG: glycoside hydrolase family 78 protein [Anaerolineae bacterium]|nr:glycoside hydrolase family 78 protein [Anaerolineae bacterium]